MNKPLASMLFLLTFSQAGWSDDTDFSKNECVENNLQLIHAMKSHLQKNTSHYNSEEMSSIKERAINTRLGASAKSTIKNDEDREFIAWLKQQESCIKDKYAKAN